MAGMKKIDAYKTTDGRVFEDAGAAQEHQAELDLRAGLARIIEKFYCRSIDEGGIADGLVENIDELRGLIT